MPATAIVPPTIRHSDSVCADGLASIPEAGDFLSLGRSKIYQMLDAGLLPSCKIGRCRRIPWRAVYRLAEESLVGAID